MNASRHRPLDLLARITAWSIGIAAVGSAIEAAMLLSRVTQIDRAAVVLTRFRLATEGTAMVGALATAISVVSLCALVGWLGWQYRAVSLLHAGAIAPKYRPQWSVLWWLVPVADLWMPGAINADLWRTSHRSAATSAASWPVWIWWTVFVVGWIAHGTGHIVRQVVLGTSAIWVEPPGPLTFSPQEVVAAVRVGSVIAGIGAVGLVVAGPLAIHILSRVTKRISELEPGLAPARPDV